MNNKEVNKDEIKSLLAEYYKSIPTGRALAECRFSLQQSLQSINYALSFGSIENILKEKKEIESRLTEIKKKLEERKKEAGKRRVMTKKELKALKRSVKQPKKKA